MSKIIDTQIKQWIIEYQQTGNGYAKIAEDLSEYIYNFPAIRYHQSEDVCGEFFLYFFDRLPKTLGKYKVQNCLFISWFVVVLQMHYLNWAKKNKKENPNTIIYLDDLLPIDQNQTDRDIDPDREPKIKTIQKTLNSLPAKVRLVMKLHFFEFFNAEDLKDISIIFKQDFSYLMNKYKNILEYTFSQYQAQQELLDRLNTSFTDLSTLKKSLKNWEKNNISRDLLLKKINKLEDKHIKNLKQFRRFYISLKSQVISDFLGLSTNSVHNLVYRGKAMLKEKLRGEGLC